jgi:hypothetical protein
MTRSLLTLILVFCATSIVRGEGPAEGIPQLKVLSNYVGTWEAEVTSDQSPLTRGTHTAKWILDGRFLQQDVTVTSDDGQLTITSRNLYTYDTNVGKYRTWSFISDGNAYSSTGTWDDSTRTLTFTNTVNGLDSKTTAHFAEDGVEQWRWQITGPNGDTVFDMKGVSRRTQK